MRKEPGTPAGLPGVVDNITGGCARFARLTTG